MNLELVLFKACPFAQRVVIILDHLGVSCKRTFVNPSDRPDWLFDLSPMGQVPLIKINDTQVIFDSVAIGEFLNDLTHGTLLSADTLERGIQRALVEWAGTCQRAFGECIAAADEKAWHRTIDDLSEKLSWVEKLAHDSGPYLMGDRFSLVDAAMAPLFMRLQALHHIVPCYDREEIPKMARAMPVILAMQVVQGSIEGDFSRIFRMMVAGRGKGGYVDSRMG
ncbi:MAG: glutathione S-transferase family protein [Magnetococcales bacterium]|nr:glutathione S-transferase family protein [Magnetococcales bacterium]